MKYKCIPCNHEFEVKKGAKPRCPRCLKIHDLEQVEGGGQTQSGSRPLLVPAIVLLLAGAVGAVYVMLDKDDTSPVEEAVNAKSVFEKAGVPKDEAEDPCAPKKAVKALAEKLADGEDGEAGMDALFKGIIGLKEQNRWTPHPQREPRDTRPLTAAELAEKLTGEGEPWQATSYELACLLLASARALDIDASMVALKQFKGEKKPADAEGKFGRYAVAHKAAPKDTKPIPVYDLYSGRSKTGAIADVDILSEAGAMAPYFGLGALSLLVKQDMSEAISLNDIAIKLDDKNPYFRSTRGFIFAATGVPSESLVEFEKALKLSNGPVERINLAEILMLLNPMDKRAETEVEAALKDAPDFARAHALKGIIHLVRQEKEQAETELALAERLDPKSPSIAMYWARYHSATMNSEEAVAKAKQAVALSGNSVSMLLGLAGIYREVARFDDMRETLDQVFAKVDTPQMADQIKGIFRYDPSPEADEAGTDDDSAKSAEASKGSEYELKLGEGFGSGKLGDGKLGGGGLGGSKNPGLGGNLDLDLNLK